MTIRLRTKALSPDSAQYYMRRVFFKAMGATEADLEKPLVAVADTWNEILPGSQHPARTLSVALSDEEIRQRLASWQPPIPDVTKGYLAHFAKHAVSADKGACLD